MFTGIIEEVGKIKNIQDGTNYKLTIAASKILEDIHLGDSIAVNGICLTAIKWDNDSFTVDVMSFVNLERALAANGRFGGHIVSGHIDGTGEIINIRRDANAVWYKIKTSEKIMEFIIEKGSIAIDGISLTVAKVDRSAFYVSVIPHTLENTILLSKKPGDIVNLENDIVGKYIKSFTDKNSNSPLCESFLKSNGF